MARILIAEDEPGIALTLEDDLMLDGYEVEVVADGEAASRRGREGAFDLLLLDIMLPLKTGFDVCRELRRAGVSAPILMLTARTQEADKIMGLDLGADDYVTKPFSPHELRARIRALLRRSAAGSTDPQIFAFRDVEVDFTRGELRRGGKTSGDQRARVQAAGDLHPQPRTPVVARTVAGSGSGAWHRGNGACCG